MAGASDQVNKLMEWFAGLTLDQGRALYATLSREQQAALDDAA